MRSTGHRIAPDARCRDGRSNPSQSPRAAKGDLPCCPLLLISGLSSSHWSSSARAPSLSRRATTIAHPPAAGNPGHFGSHHGDRRLEPLRRRFRPRRDFPPTGCCGPATSSFRTSTAPRAFRAPAPRSSGSPRPAPDRLSFRARPRPRRESDFRPPWAFSRAASSSSAPFRPTDGTCATVSAGELLIFDRNGKMVETLADGTLLDGPWDLTIRDKGDRAQVFVSNVLSGTVTRLDLTIPHGRQSHRREQDADRVRIQDGLQRGRGRRRADRSRPGPRWRLLYVASTDDNAIFVVRTPFTGRTTGQGPARLSGRHAPARTARPGVRSERAPSHRQRRRHQRGRQPVELLRGVHQERPVRGLVSDRPRHRIRVRPCRRNGRRSRPLRGRRRQHEHARGMVRGPLRNRRAGAGAQRLACRCAPTRAHGVPEAMN